MYLRLVLIASTSTATVNPNVYRISQIVWCPDELSLWLVLFFEVFLNYYFLINKSVKLDTFGPGEKL